MRIAAIEALGKLKPYFKEGGTVTVWEPHRRFTTVSGLGAHLMGEADNPAIMTSMP